MTEAELNRFKVLLENRLSEVTRAHGEHKGSLSSVQDRTDVESGDWPQELENLEVEEQVVESEEWYLDKIRDALRRIEKGTYGLCSGCGEQIPLARLEARPSVSLCVDCQEQKDSG